VVDELHSSSILSQYKGGGKRLKGQIHQLFADVVLMLQELK